VAWLIRLYPRRWRERYGGELEQLVHDLRPSTSTVAIAIDLVKGALAAHVQQRCHVKTSDRNAIKRGVLIAGIAWLGVSAEILLTSVVFPSKNDNDGISVVISYLCIFALLYLTGVLAARHGASRTGQVVAGLVAGALIGALTVVTFAVVDNVWLGIVSQQQTKIDGFASSGAASMREYLNHSLIGPAVFFPVFLGAFGAALGGLGGLTERERLLPSSARAVRHPES
jgi:hypothetical protein